MTAHLNCSIHTKKVLIRPELFCPFLFELNVKLSLSETTLENNIRLPKSEVRLDYTSQLINTKFSI